MNRDNIKSIFRRIGISLPAGLPPPVSSLYTQYLSQLSSEEQQSLLIELKDLSEDQYEALSCDLRVNKEQIKQLVKILEEIQPNFDKIKEISAKTFENTELIKAYFEERTKQLLKKFQYGKKLEKEDIIEGLVSWNIKVRTMAAVYAGKYSIKETTKFLIKNLSAPEDDLILFSIRSLSQIRAVEAFNYILPFVNHPNNKIAKEARWYLRNSDLINQENFDMWLSWLLGYDKELKEISIGNLHSLQLKGRLDVKSIKKELKALIRNNDADLREMAIYLLSEIEGISSEVDFEKSLYDESEGRFVKSAIAHALFFGQ